MTVGFSVTADQVCGKFHTVIVNPESPLPVSGEERVGCKVTGSRHEGAERTRGVEEVGTHTNNGRPR